MNDIEKLYLKLEKDISKDSYFSDRILVKGAGDINASIVLVGEAPGGEEEKLKTPFVGAAGKNLNGFLDVIGISREDIYLTNVVKVRPFKISEKTNKPINRPPDSKEVSFFTPYLIQELNIISPKYIVILGNFALRAVMEDKDIKIGDCHGELLKKGNSEVFPLYHPASIIYNQQLKSIYQEDLIKFKNIIS